MDSILRYKGYRTTIKYDAELRLLRGCIDGINDYVDFESDDPKKIETEFHNAVDDYLEFCAKVGKEPEKEYRGQFNVRIDPLLHRDLAYHASVQEKSINSIVETAIAEYIEKNKGDRKTNIPNSSRQYVSENY